MRRAVASYVGFFAVVIGVAPALAAPGLSRPGPPPRVTFSELLRQELSSLRQLRQQRIEIRRISMGRRAVQGELRRVRVALMETRRRLKAVKGQVAKRQGVLRARVRALYRLVRATARLPLLDSRRAKVPRDGRDALLKIVRRDVSELAHLRAERDLLARALVEVRKRRSQAWAVRGDLDRRRDRVQARVAQCQQELSGGRHRIRNHRGHGSEFNRAARALQKQVLALAAQLKREAVTFASRRGKLVRPVPGLILRWFGETSVAGTKTTTAFKGVVISALPNWKVLAPAPGQVRYTGAVAGFGKVVIIDHDEGFISVVGYLDRLLVNTGDQVNEGRALAVISGGKGRAKVYYELRLSGQPIDPIPWMRGGLAELVRRGPKRLRRAFAARRGRRLRLRLRHRKGAPVGNSTHRTATALRD